MTVELEVFDFEGFLKNGVKNKGEGALDRRSKEMG